MIDNAIYQILAADSDVVAIVGQNVFTIVAAQSDLNAYVVIYLIDGTPENTKDGASSLDTMRIQIDSFHVDKNKADDLAAAIRDTLDRYRGVKGSYTIDKIIWDSARNDYDFDRDLYKISQDFLIRQVR